MQKIAAEWIWRVAMLAALVWIGVELHQVHEDLIQQPADMQTAMDAEPDELQASIEDLQDDVDVLAQKVDALLAATAQLKR